MKNRLTWIIGLRIGRMRMNDYKVKDFNKFSGVCNNTFYSISDKKLYCVENKKECSEINCPLLEKVNNIYEDDLK